MRALAARAQVATSTVARVEAGALDPTVGMLTRLLHAAGHRLELDAVLDTGLELADLHDAWSSTPAGDRPDWTRLRAFLDALARRPDRLSAAVRRRPPPSGSPVMDTLLAAMAEKACNDAGLVRPAWTRGVPGLGAPWASPGTPAMQAAVRAATPPELAARGLRLDERSLWRDPAGVGV